eukprot:gene3-biopygen2
MSCRWWATRACPPRRLFFWRAGVAPSHHPRELALPSSPGTRPPIIPGSSSSHHPRELALPSSPGARPPIIPGSSPRANAHDGVHSALPASWAKPNLLTLREQVRSPATGQVSAPYTRRCMSARPCSQRRGV